MKYIQKIKNILLGNRMKVAATVMILCAIIFGARYIYAFTDNTSTPPANDAAEPLNVSTTSQTKAGPLTVGPLNVNGPAGISGAFAQYVNNSDGLYLFGVTGLDNHSIVQTGLDGQDPKSGYGATENRLSLQPYAGEVGIGTLNPSGATKLTVNGKVGADSYCDQTGVYCFTPSSTSTGINNGGSNSNSATSTNYWTLTGTNIYNNNSGNVGIGTTAPNAKLQIGDGSSGDVYFRVAGKDSANSSLSVVGGIYNQENGGFFGTETNHKLTLRTNNQPRVTIAAGGNVGIGSLTPSSQLTFSGNNNTIGLDNGNQILAKNSAGTPEVFLWPRWTDNITYLNYGSAGFNIRNDSSVSTMFMNNAGYVGIGNINPQYRLDVNGDAQTLGHLFIGNRIPNTASNDGGPVLQLAGNVPAADGSGAIAGGIIRASTDPSDTTGNGVLSMQAWRYQIGLLTIDTRATGADQKIVFNGRVKSTDAFKAPSLCIDSDLCVSNWGAAYTQGKNEAGGSDEKLKKNIETMNGSLNKILKLRPVTYEFKDPSRGAGEQIGVIAQEVEKVFPDLVDTVTTASSSYKSVQYDRLVAPLIGAVQEQQTQIEALKTQNATLTKQNQDFESRLEKLESK